MVKWDQLFNFVYSKCEFSRNPNNEPTWKCDTSLKHTEEFCKNNNLDFAVVKRILESYGGHCDCEVVFNVEDKIEYDAEIHDVVLPAILGPSDPEKRPDDTFCFFIPKVDMGWMSGFVDEDAANRMRDKMVKEGYKCNDVMIDFNARAARMGR